ncbi:MAG: zinc dependent phospholipase C family protein [Massiliimalia sp.]|jgi:hypothetical protein
MPDFTTHYLFGEQVFEELSPDIQTIIGENRTAFNYGTEGPDFLFFFRSISGALSGNPLVPLGSRLHSQHIGETMDFMKHYIASKQEDAEEYRVLCAYYMGFICHYFLDKTVHPYVYFLQGSLCAHHPERTPRSMHCRIEAELDSILYQFFKKKPVTTFSVKNHFTMDAFSKNVISRMYSELFETVFDTSVEVKDLMQSFDDTRNASCLLYDNSGVLPVMRNILGELFPKTLDITYMIKPKTVKTDTANIRENLWHHPLNPDQKSRKSVLGLFHDAKDAVVPALEATFDTLNDPGSVPFDTSLTFGGNPVDVPEEDF